MIISLILLNALLATAVIPREKAPAFRTQSVIDGKFRSVSLDDYAGMWRVLLFYPADFTFVCPTELISFNEKVPAFLQLNTQVIGISTDTHHVHLAWIKTARSDGGLGKIDFPLAADASKDISKSYGVLVTNTEDPMNGLALRGLFIVDPRGLVRHTQINDDQAGRSVDEIIRLIKAFQFADEHGEVCPASWQPGSATIKPDQERKSEYFRTVFKADPEL